MARIEQGTVNEVGEAIFRVTVFGADGISSQVGVVLDTGFTDCLALPTTLIEALGLQFADYVVFEMADGSQLSTSAYDGVIEWLGERQEVTIIASQGGFLIGLGLLYGLRLSIDVVDGGIATIERLSPAP